MCEGNSAEHSRVQIMDSDGSNIHPLFSTKIDRDDFAPHFTPDGKEIYFARSSPFAADVASEPAGLRTWDLYSATVDGKNERPLTNQLFGFFRLALSIDGRKLILTEDTAGGTRLRLYSLDDPGDGEIAIQPVIPKGTLDPINNVAFVSDGQSIYFLAASNATKAFDYDVYRSNLADNKAEQLTTANGYATDLCVSSDGKTAVFLRWTSRWGSLPNLAKLYVLNLTTKRVTALNVTGAQ